MIKRIFLSMLLLTFVEWTLIIEVHRYWSRLWGSANGWYLSLGSLVLAAMVGVSLARAQGLRLLQEAQQQLRQGIPPSRSMLDGLLLIAGAVLLILPGYLTDLMGLVLLIPQMRALVAKRLLRGLAMKVQRGSVVMHRGPMHAESEPLNRLRNEAVGGEIIDVEATRD